MKSGLLLKFTLLLLLLLATSSDGFFLDPKKALLEFLQSLKEKKEAKKKPSPSNNIQHYHVHYYPPQIHLVSTPPVKAPEKHELESVHTDYLSSLGWSNYEYKYTPEPRIAITSSFHDLWSDPWGEGPDFSKRNDPGENGGILVQVPLSQQVIIEQPHSTHKLKMNLLTSYFKKLTSPKNSVYS